MWWKFFAICPWKTVPKLNAEPVHPEREGAHEFAYNPTLPGPHFPWLPTEVNSQTRSKDPRCEKICAKRSVKISWLRQSLKNFSDILCFNYNQEAFYLWTRGKSQIALLTFKLILILKASIQFVSFSNLAVTWTQNYFFFSSQQLIATKYECPFSKTMQ